MSRHLRSTLIGMLFLLICISVSAQVAPELYWALNINPQRANGYANMIWFDLNGLPGPDPVPASPAIPLPYGTWTAEAGPWYLDAVQVVNQPSILLVLTAGYGGELRAFRTSATTLMPCGSYSLSDINGENSSVRVAPSGSFAAVILGSSPTGAGDNILFTFRLDLTAPHNVSGNCLLAGSPAQFPITNDTAVRNVDFNPNTNREVAISGYSNKVTFMDPTTGTLLCEADLGSSDTGVEARYNPAGSEVWASSYNGQEIAVIQPPAGNPVTCPVTRYINGFGPFDNLGGGSFHPNSNIHVYYVESYPQGNVYAIDTVTKTVSQTIHEDGAIGMTAVTRGTNGTYYLEMPVAGCSPCFSRTDTYDVTGYDQAHNFSSYLGAHASGMDWQRIATVRTVSR